TLPARPDRDPPPTPPRASATAVTPVADRPRRVAESRPPGAPRGGQPPGCARRYEPETFRPQLVWGRTWRCRSGRTRRDTTPPGAGRPTAPAGRPAARRRACPGYRTRRRRPRPLP